ncbi:FimV/HubP family polar landmark protein, partial [Lysobacter sp. D1-1-M9]
PAAAAPEPAAASDDAIASVPAPAPAAAPAPVAPAPPAVDGASGLSGVYAVQRGDTLSGIAGQLDRGGYSLDQAMIALLRSNPRAFIDGNINLLKAGAVLRIPATADVGDIDATEALALVRSHVQQWREATRPVPQPATAGETATTQPAADSTAATAGAAGSVSADARLEIVPPGASTATEAGSQSGISAGGEGDMLRQEMQQTRETLAAREAELAEMRSRIEDLEQLQQQQQQLLSMKDSELAAAQQRLAQAGETTAAGEAAPAPALLPWLVGGFGLLLAVLGGWLWSRRTRAPKPVFRAPVAAAGGSSLADAFPSRSLAATPEHETVDRADQVVPEAPIEQADAAGDGHDTSPTWHPGDLLDTAPRPPADEAAAAPASAQADARQASPDSSAPEQAEFEQAGLEQAEFEQATPEPTPAAQERLELARAYLDIGDRDSARQLLDEIAADGDRGARQHAARMLREID